MKKKTNNKNPPSTLPIFHFLAGSTRTRIKLQERLFKSVTRKNFVAVKIIVHWNSLYKVTVGPLLLEARETLVMNDTGVLDCA